KLHEQFLSTPFYVVPKAVPKRKNRKEKLSNSKVRCEHSTFRSRTSNDFAYRRMKLQKTTTARAMRAFLFS
ncbi:hypothetical protein MJI09_24285, partial [Salmonella enterica subsp. enterica serovar Anatum]|nr:hypothetical protein [Salmonella enterica subsp. enterica serovar Anatum]